MMPMPLYIIRFSCDCILLHLHVVVYYYHIAKQNSKDIKCQCWLPSSLAITIILRSMITKRGIGCGGIVPCIIFRALPPEEKGRHHVAAAATTIRCVLLCVIILLFSSIFNLQLCTPPKLLRVLTCSSLRSSYKGKSNFLTGWYNTRTRY